MICNYGNQSQEIMFPVKSLCSERYGGVLLEIGYTTSDYFIIFIGAVVFLAIIALLLFISKEKSKWIL